MTNFIPIFPLDIIVYPGEALNLHIFEPRYKQLILECISEKKPFGIPSIQNKQVSEYGTLVKISELVQTYGNGEMDIRTEGVSIFRVLEMVKEIPGKLYSGAIVNHPHNTLEVGNFPLIEKIFEEVRRMYALLSVSEKFPAQKMDFRSYDIAHYIGLSLRQEYELLCIFTEIQRLEYIRRHLTLIMPVLSELEEMKARIQRNGHFRDLSAKDFNL